MKNFNILILLIFTALISCGQDTPVKKQEKAETETKEKAQMPNAFEKISHNYGGWYCPDNLNGFPAVDIMNWKDVPVVNGRLATKEEAQNGTSLIFVDSEKYPYAKPLDMKMPRLAKFYNPQAGKEQIIIVIQAVNISHDSIIGFRYLNGGNGSTDLINVKFLSDKEIASITPSNFVALDIQINATQDEIWQILTTPKYSQQLQTIFDADGNLKDDWNKTSKVNFIYPQAGTLTSEYAENLYGNQYIQIDFESDNVEYAQKFLLLEDEETKTTELQIVCGPYGDDFEAQKEILFNWAQKVRDLSEIKK